MLGQDSTTPTMERLRASTTIPSATAGKAAEPKKARAKPTPRSKPALAESIAYNPAEAADVARCGRSTIYRAIAAGELKAHKRGSRTFILDEELRAWLRAMPAFKSGGKAA